MRYFKKLLLLGCLIFISNTVFAEETEEFSAEETEEFSMEYSTIEENGYSFEIPIGWRLKSSKNDYVLTIHGESDTTVIDWRKPYIVFNAIDSRGEDEATFQKERDNLASLMELVYGEDNIGTYDFYSGKRDGSSGWDKWYGVDAEIQEEGVDAYTLHTKYVYSEKGTFEYNYPLKKGEEELVFDVSDEGFEDVFDTFISGIKKIDDVDETESEVLESEEY